jgi:catechol 2,3-dioxygenase-like lactoylglutathione lyase family enzyme
MLHERRVLFTGDAMDIFAQRRVPDRPLGRCALSCTLGRTDKEEDVDLRLDLVGIVARDMRASLEFYRRLGLDIPEGAEDEPHAEVTTPSGLRIAWDAAELIRRIDPGWTDPSGGHRVALAFLCPDPAGVDAKYQELAALGFGHKDPWDAFWGQRYASVKDPDGNQVDLFAPL